jgi:hypothetical protein
MPGLSREKGREREREREMGETVRGKPTFWPYFICA